MDGFRFFFFSNEGNEPPHVHVEAAEKYAKFWLRPVALARSYGFGAHELSGIRRIVESRSDYFEHRWGEYFGEGTH
ncbi:DUF4160 domain-containing protein [Limnochorda pilosa]|uniref:DUF4160 domain-containing protein n=1 Tax=Limnochorda pilosa TaxID=1555112 RepID=A0A0K2SH62_LIMPI|nr:DUF4160 domain-containing protein [Limnochorda pilosa]BAS26461.1 hypothetical protein LIP_0604 [Limnochorda pilosa]